MRWFFFAVLLIPTKYRRYLSLRFIKVSLKNREFYYILLWLPLWKKVTTPFLKVSSRENGLKKRMRMPTERIFVKDFIGVNIW